MGISIPAFREEGDLIFFKYGVCADIISIPAFREEGDPRAAGPVDQSSISIPAFREEGDHKPHPKPVYPGDFNPRLP